MKRKSIMASLAVASLMVGLVVGHILPAASETAPTEAVQGKGQIITLASNILVPAASQDFIVTDPVRVAKYKQLSFLVRTGTADGEPIYDQTVREEVKLDVLFTDAPTHDEIPFSDRVDVESVLYLPLVYHGIETTVVDVAAPYAYVWADNDSTEDVVITVKAYATE